MASGYQVYVKLFYEVLDNILVEDIANSTLTFLILFVLIFFRVSPKEITQKALVRDISGSLEHLYITVVGKFLAQTTVHTQNLVVYQRCHRQLLEHVDKLFEKPTILLVVILQLYF